MSLLRLLSFVFFTAVSALSPAHAQTIRGVPIFETPLFAEQENIIYLMIRSGAHERAAERLQLLAERFPEAPRIQVIQARLAISRNDAEAAVDALTDAASLGVDNLQKVVAAPAFQALANDARIVALLNAPAAPAPKTPFALAPIKKGAAKVTAKNSRWKSDLARIEVAFAFPPTLKFKPVSLEKEGVMARLTQLVRRGRAAGNFGDIYDNRDSGHSLLRGLKDVQLVRTVYGDAAKASNLHYGLNETLIFNAPTLGNSSTALTGQSWRSQPRHAMTTQYGPTRAWQLYDNNHVYVYPEHRDHDAVKDKGRGDLFPANTPLMLISKGSSGSDKPFLKAIQVIFAGFKPKVKALLVRENLIAPTVQQVLRRSMMGIENDDDYLTPAAHPTVFDGKDLRLGKALDLAQSIAEDAVPPRAQIKMTSEPRRHAPFAAPMSEELFATPDAIAHTWRGAERQRSYTFSAAGSYDVNDRPLTFYWRVLRGDPRKIRIEKTKPDASEVKVSIDWHEGITSPKGLKSSRVDIGLFAYNGAEYSAPAIFSLDLPGHQRRVYPDDPSDLRPLSISYMPAKGERTYSDNVVWPTRGWNDVYDYDQRGNLLGWTRTYFKGQKARFTQHGLKTVEQDQLGRPLKAELLRYKIDRNDKGHTFLREQPTGRLFTYAYTSDDARLGVPTEVKSD